MPPDGVSVDGANGGDDDDDDDDGGGGGGKGGRNKLSRESGNDNEDWGGNIKGRGTKYGVWYGRRSSLIS